MSRLTPDMAARFARLTLGHVGRQYPYKLDLVMAGAEDALPPIAHHPIFHGSFDWHSCVHGWWQLFHIARRFPDLDVAADISARANAMFTPEKVAGELAFLARPTAAGFERPYGWAWLLALHGELVQHDAPWAGFLEPLARAFAERFHKFLPKLTYPLRVGTHFNIAFALTLAHDWACAHDAPLAGLISERAHHWFIEDRDCQAWEPGGDEFLSSALCEALLMSRLLPEAPFTTWLDQFLPRLAAGEPATLFTPAQVSDRSDGKIAHLDGLNLSRAWCWRGIGRHVSAAHPISQLAEAAAVRHLDASLPHVAGDYMGEHWLATFALMALTA
jgi:Protein of unknown function (DUF2891)